MLKCDAIIGPSLSVKIVEPGTYTVNNSNNLICVLASRVYKSKHFFHPCHLKIRKGNQPIRQSENQRHQVQNYNRWSMYLITLLYMYKCTSSSIFRIHKWTKKKSILYLWINTCKTVNLFTEEMNISRSYTKAISRSKSF